MQAAADRSLAQTRWLIWGLIGVTALVTAMAFWVTHSTLALGRYGCEVPLLPVFLLGTAWFYRVVRPDPSIARGCEAAAQMAMIAGLSAVLNLALAAAGAAFPYRDPWLALADATLGFDWHACMAFVDARPGIQLLLKASYLSLNVTYPIVLLTLICSGQQRRLDRFIIALWATLMLTMAIFLFVPARAAYAYFGVQAADLHTLHPTAMMNRSLPLIAEMRLPGPHVIYLNDLEGLVTFPSFHAAAAVLFTWAVWVSRAARWPMLAVNLVMVVAAPIEGAHYLVDIIAGGGTAAAAIALAGACQHRLARIRPAAFHQPPPAAGIATARLTMTANRPARTSGPIGTPISVASRREISGRT